MFSHIVFVMTFKTQSHDNIIIPLLSTVVSSSDMEIVRHPSSYLIQLLRNVAQQLTILSPHQLLNSLLDYRKIRKANSRAVQSKLMYGIEASTKNKISMQSAGIWLPFIHILLSGALKTGVLLMGSAQEAHQGFCQIGILDGDQQGVGVHWSYILWLWHTPNFFLQYSYTLKYLSAFQHQDYRLPCRPTNDNASFICCSLLLSMPYNLIQSTIVLCCAVQIRGFHHSGPLGLVNSVTSIGSLMTQLEKKGRADSDYTTSITLAYLHFKGYGGKRIGFGKFSVYTTH